MNQAVLEPDISDFGSDLGVLTSDPAKILLKGRVMIIDDEPSILSLFGRVLRSAGFAVQEVRDGRNVAAALTRHRFDVVVTDLMMPSMDGIEILKIVRSAHPDVPVILMTGQATVATAAKAVEFGALRYLTKPISPNDLVKVIVEATEVHHAAQTRERALRSCTWSSAKRLEPISMAASTLPSARSTWSINLSSVGPTAACTPTKR